MFTGIVEELGVVETAGSTLWIRCDKVRSDLALGGSIAVNGVCLTAVEITSTSFRADLAPETLSRSNLGDLKPGSFVNLERPVTPATLLSGHIVQGHVDATAETVALNDLGAGNWWISVVVPERFGKYLVEKGSITLDGISLTIAGLDPGPVVSVTIIPHTFAATTLGRAKIGDRLNVEVDVLAKHVEKLLAASLLSR